MARGKGGPFFALINSHLNNAEFSFSRGDYGNTISHMQSLAELLNVTLPQPPMHDPRSIPVMGGETSTMQRSYIIHYRPLIARSVRKWMDKHSRGQIGLWDEDDEDDVGVPQSGKEDE